VIQTSQSSISHIWRKKNEKKKTIAILQYISRCAYLLGGESGEQVLLVGEDEDGDLGELLLLQQRGELAASVLDALRVGGVDDKDERVGAVVIVLPVGADRLLAADVPHVELEVGRLDRLDVEALRGHDLLDLLVRQAAHNGGLAGVVEAQEKDAELGLGLLELAEVIEEAHWLIESEYKGHAGREKTTRWKCGNESR